MPFGRTVFHVSFTLGTFEHKKNLAVHYIIVGVVVVNDDGLSFLAVGLHARPAFTDGYKQAVVGSTWPALVWGGALNRSGEGVCRTQGCCKRGAPGAREK